MTTATQVFDSTGTTPVRVIVHVFSHADFADLRRGLRGLLEIMVAGDDNDHESVDHLRCALARWLTEPLMFGDEFARVIDELGSRRDVERRYGPDAGMAWQKARDAAATPSDTVNPMNPEIASVWQAGQEAGHECRLLCSKQARPVLASVCGMRDDTPVFILSSAQYRNAAPFQTLIKIGPFRDHGWGRTPDAVITAPRQHVVHQFVWEGCNDSDGFGFDPIASAGGTASGIGSRSREVLHDSSAGLGQERWLDGGPDDLRFAAELTPQHAISPAVPAVGLHLANNRTLLQRRFSPVLSLDLSAEDDRAVSLRPAAFEVEEGMFIVFPPDRSDYLPRFQETQYAQVWKAALVREHERDGSADLLRRLRDYIALKDLGGAIRLWRSPSTSAIHAPHRSAHFFTLLRELRINKDHPRPAVQRGATWWSAAWNEVMDSRSWASQAGAHKRDAQEKEMLEILPKQIHAIRALARTCDEFSIDLDGDHSSLQGNVQFVRVECVDHGYSAPEHQIGRQDLQENFDIWRR